MAAARAAQLLDGGNTLFAGAAAAGIDLADLRDLQLLTAKPFLYVFNIDDDELAGRRIAAGALAGLVAPAESIFLDAKTESELVELPEDEAAELRPSSGSASLGWRSWPGRDSPRLACPRS